MLAIIMFRWYAAGTCQLFSLPMPLMLRRFHFRRWLHLPISLSSPFSLPDFRQIFFMMACALHISYAFALCRDAMRKIRYAMLPLSPLGSQSRYIPCFLFCHTRVSCFSPFLSLCHAAFAIMLLPAPLKLLLKLFIASAAMLPAADIYRYASLLSPTFSRFSPAFPTTP